MNYAEAINYIHSTPKFAKTLGNEPLAKLLFNLGNPHDKLKFIHIAGTNGKGSCSFMLSEILQKSGYNVGLYTSPYIEVFNERIRVNGEVIPDNDLAKITTEIKATIERCKAPVSEFALDTAIAFMYFEKCNCDIVVLETGLGGRLDATNVINKSELSVITSIGLDHTQYLGDTIEKITAEKCGIIKQNGNVVCYPQLDKAALDTIKHFCKLKAATLTIAESPTILDGNSFRLNNITYTLGMNGDFQKYNAALALTAVKKLIELGYDITPDAALRGLREAFNPARLEILPNGMYLDGAHNPSAAAALCQSLKKLNKPIKLLIAMMADKDISAVVAELAKLNPTVIATEIPMPRCASAEELCVEFKKHNIIASVIKDPVVAAKNMLLSKNDDEIIIACGSFYLVGQLRKELK